MSKKRVFASSAIVGVVTMFALLSPGAQAEEPPPLPIDPTQGESSLLTVVNSIPLNVIDNALDHFPVPYVIVASAGGATPTIITSNAGQPNNIDADLSKSTGKGGHDIKVELNTVLTPTHRLELTVDRLGSAPFASNVTVFVGFPFDAFNSEDLDLPADPNLFIGFQTTTSTGAPGGIVPLKETFVLTPDILAGTSHLVSLQMITDSAANPLRFLAGHFDGTNETGIVNASGIAAHTNPVPNQINVALDFGESPIAEPGTTATSIGVDWTATARTLLTFNYFEDESGVPSLSNPADYGSSLVVDQMPTDEELTLTLDEDEGALTLSHRANSVIDQISFTKRRLDGLDIRGVATDVPTEVDLTLDLDGAAVLDVNANTLDMRVSAEQRGGFLNTSAFFGYDVGYAEAFFGNAPDLTAAFMPDEDRYQVQATNPGESIEQAGLVLDDGPVAVIDGAIDVNGDDLVDTADDDTIADIAVINGALDIDGDGDIDGNDDGDIHSSAAGTTAVINGMFDVDDDGDVDTADDGDVTILQLAPSWIDVEPHHIFSLADFGDEGTAAARAVNISTAALDLDAPTVIDGQVDLNNSGTADGDDDGVLGIDLAVIDGRLDIDDDGDVDNSDDSDSTLGHKIIDGRIDFDDDLDVDANDDGPLTVHTYRMATTAASPLQAYARSEPGAALMPDRRIDAVCDVDDIPAGAINFQIVFPPPDINVSYKTDPPTGIDSVNCTGHIDETFFELALSDLPPEFEMDLDPDQHLKLRAEDGTGTPNSDTLGSLVARFCYDPDWDDCNDEAVDPEPAGGLPSTGAIFGNPLHDARARADEIPSFLGEWGAGARNVIDALVDINGDAAVDGNDDGRFGGFAVIDGRVDMNGDGAISGSDDGRYLGKRVVDGLVDTSDDGVGAANDDGTVSGSSNRFDTGVPDATLFLEGMQVDVSTKVGLDPLPAADPSQDHYLRLVDLGLDVDNVTPLEQRLSAGAFGIDEIAYSTDDGGRGLALNYKANQDHALIVDVDTDFDGKFFPQYAIDLNLTVDDVPHTWDFFTDMATEVTYAASSGIDDVTLTGSIDDTDDANDTNGTTVDGLLQTLPASLRLHLETDSVPVIDGKLNVNGAGGVDGDDDAIYAGFRIIDGLIDINGDGLTDANDDGNLLGLPVFDGMIDTNGSGAADGDDDSAIAGASLRMNAAIDVVSLELTSTNKIVGTDYQLAEFEILDIPAQWNANWGGGRFLVESLDASGNRDPMGSFSARLSTSSDEGTNLGKVLPFTLDGPQLSGPVLGNPGDSGGCRVNYSPFAQEVDARYYNAAPGIDPSVVFSRLRKLYCDSEEFLAGQDHALARMEDVNGDGSEAEIGFASLQFSGFQRISWIPDANGGQFIFRAPTPGLHPLFMGVELADQFATMNIKNIPDEVIVDVDTDEHITYDAFDDTDASIDEIDLYVGPLPLANDENPAGRVVIDFNNNVINTHDFVHMRWNFDFPNGGAFFNSSEQIDLLALVQDGDSRVTGGLGFEDVHVAYGLDLFSFDVTEEFGFEDVPCPIPPDFECDFTAPSAWELVQFEAGADNDADAESLTLPLAFNSDKQTIGGFLAVYDRIGGVQQLANPAPGINPGANEYVPFVTVEGTGFGIAYVNAVVSLDPISPNVGCIVFPACVSVTVDIDFEGAATLDIWSNVDTSETFGVEGVFEIGFENLADYTENDPFHIFPVGTPRFDFVDGLVLTFDGFHDFNDHVQPFVS